MTGKLLSGFGKSGKTRHRSGPLTVTVAVSVDEWGGVELLKVEGDEESAQDVSWFKESWRMVGADLLWFRDECPARGVWEVKGHLESFWCCGEWDEEFVIEELTASSAPKERKV